MKSLYFMGQPVIQSYIVLTGNMFSSQSTLSYTWSISYLNYCDLSITIVIPYLTSTITTKSSEVRYLIFKHCLLSIKLNHEISQ